MTLKMRLSPCITCSKVLKPPNELCRESETALAEVSPADCSAAAAFEVSWNRWRGHRTTLWAGCHPGSAPTGSAWGHNNLNKSQRHLHPDLSAGSAPGSALPRTPTSRRVCRQGSGAGCLPASGCEETRDRERHPPKASPTRCPPGPGCEDPRDHKRCTAASPAACSATCPGCNSNSSSESWDLERSLHATEPSHCFVGTVGWASDRQRPSEARPATCSATCPGCRSDQIWDHERRLHATPAAGCARCPGCRSDQRWDHERRLHATPATCSAICPGCIWNSTDQRWDHERRLHATPAAGSATCPGCRNSQRWDRERLQLEASSNNFLPNANHLFLPWRNQLETTLGEESRFYCQPGRQCQCHSTHRPPPVAEDHEKVPLAALSNGFHARKQIVLFGGHPLQWMHLAELLWCCDLSSWTPTCQHPAQHSPWESRSVRAEAMLAQQLSTGRVDKVQHDSSLRRHQVRCPRPECQQKPTK